MKVINNMTPLPNQDPVEILKLMLSNSMITQAKEFIVINKLNLKVELREGKPVLLESNPGVDVWLDKFITQDTEMLKMKDEARILSKTDDEVLILGESGTGKELIARAMIGERDGKFCRINCAAVPRELIESELFGHERGSFTGANAKKIGMMEAASDGVLFLDEVGDLPLDVQAKLLNALQPVDGKRYIRSIGATNETEINCRIVCATHKNLMDMVEHGAFRLDLYARISTFELRVAPLSKRIDDVVPIVVAIAKSLNVEEKTASMLNIYWDAIKSGDIKLPLNVRTLEQMVKRYALLGRI